MLYSIQQNIHSIRKPGYRRPLILSRTPVIFPFLEPFPLLGISGLNEVTEPVQSIQTTERRSHQIESADPTHWLVEQKEIISGQLPASGASTRGGRKMWRKVLKRNKRLLSQ